MCTCRDVRMPLLHYRVVVPQLEGQRRLRIVYAQLQRLVPVGVQRTLLDRGLRLDTARRLCHNIWVARATPDGRATRWR